MKEIKNDSTEAVNRFGRDKRARTVRTEHVEHRPFRQREQQRLNDGDEQLPAQPRRHSFNPNFDADNRPVREYQRRPDFNRDGFNKGFKKHDSYNNEERNFNRVDDDYARDSRPARYPQRDSERRPYGDRPYTRRTERRGGFGDGMDERRSERFDRTDRYEQRERFDRTDRGARPERPERKPYGKPAAKFGKPEGGKKGFGKHAKQADGQPKDYPKYKPQEVVGEIRLNRFIAQSGRCSRREADTYIAAGVVTVNGKVVTELGTKILPTDEVRFNNETVHGEQNVYLVLNKPKGYVTTLDDPHASKIVTDLVKNACKERIYPVGRLDKNSLGLLLFTNDGELTKQLTHPAYNKKKTYQVSLDKPLTRADMDKIAEGITLEDGDIYADEIAYIKDNKKEIGVEIHSGRNRIVRRMFEHLGYTVQKLDRVYYAGLTKKNLKRGAWRFLTKEEVRNLKAGLYE